MGLAIDIAEKGLLPDGLIKFGIRRLLVQRLKDVVKESNGDLDQYTRKLVSELKESPIAIETDAANEQHYEVPAEFYQLSLGKHLKYSSAYYDGGAKTLDEAEHQMLELTAKRAEIVDGMEVMDLGCGWGSFSLWVANKFPNCKITSVSNSASQKGYIDGEAQKSGLKNIQVITANINEFDTEKRFDRVVSVEMFEHMRNYERLMGKVSSWLKNDGKLFVHIFCHKEAPYYFETEGEDNWMGAYFFTGGIMPSDRLLLNFQDQLTIDQQWVVNGTNYEKTALAWLENTDKNRAEILKVLEETYGVKEAHVWLQRWRIFFLSCAELFGYKDGQEWWVSHYLFKANK
jgi:cyclopropane-fatty-acyl-phospholipid synthase